MKRILVIITGLIILHTACDAQYSIYKAKYDYRAYSYQMGDPYKPSLMSLASALIPGLGEIIEGESMRGLGFLGGSIALVVFKWLVILKTDASYTAIRKSALIGQIGLRVWSGIDASRIAKVNDLAFRDKYKTSYSLQIQPYINTTYYNQTGSVPAGITLIIEF